jgi:hypothetical protein
LSCRQGRFSVVDFLTSRGLGRQVRAKRGNDIDDTGPSRLF